MTAYEAEYESCRKAVEERLDSFFRQECPQKELLDAMRYSLMAGGKRIRPVLTMQFCKAAGKPAEAALDFACGVEMLHTYSLIHDDLPCMDNDDLRRGKPTCHKVFGVTTATLAGDALQAAAFRMVLSVPNKASAQAAALLAEAAGEMGMCGGQYLDTVGDGKPHTEEELKTIHSGKTGALLRAACKMGVCAANGTAEMLDAADRYAAALGMAFQIRDDILDETATTEQLGKPAGSDEANGKTTFLTLLGAAKCEQLVRAYTDEAKTALKGVFPDAGFLCWLAEQLAERNH